MTRTNEWDDALDSVELVPHEAGGEIPSGAGLSAVPPGMGILQTRGAYSTAMKVQVPRSLQVVQAKMVEESRLLGEAAYYGWGAGENAIEGPSQALAHMAARLWGNCAVEPGQVQDLPGEWVITTYFIDHETGFTLGRPFRMSKKWKVYGRHDEERKADIRFSIGASKSARNVILKAVPKSLIDRCIREAKRGMRKKLEAFIKNKGIVAAVDICVRELAKLGVTEEQILARCNVTTLKALDIDNVVTLRGDIRALQDGETRVADVFGSGEPSGPTAAEIKGKPTLAETEPAQTEAQAYLAAEIKRGLPEEVATEALLGFDAIKPGQTWKDLPPEVSLEVVKGALSSPTE